MLCFYLDQIQSLSLALSPGNFRVAEISFYIEIPRQFSNSVNEDYKNHSHGKQITFPRYTAKILGIRI